LGEVLALLEDGRHKGAVGAGFHTLPSVELPHVWLFSFCSHHRSTVFTQDLKPTYIHLQLV